MTVRSSDWIEVNGVCLRYELSGSGPETLVLLHEMGGAIESWDEVVAELKGGLRLLRYDQRGFGLSEKGREMSLEDMVADLAALLDALLILEPVTLVGAALGAAIAFGFALRYPARVRRLVTASPATGGMMREAIAAMETRMMLVQTGGMRAVTDAMFAVTYPPDMPCNQERFARHRRRWLSVDPESFIFLNRMMAGFDLTSDLARIACPVLVIGCKFDKVRSPQRSADIAQNLPNARFVVIDSGHYAPVQSPELFAGLLHDFVGSSAQSWCNNL